MPTATLPSARVLFHTEVLPPYSTPPLRQSGWTHWVACRPSLSSETANTALFSRIAFMSAGRKVAAHTGGQRSGEIEVRLAAAGQRCGLARWCDDHADHLGRGSRSGPQPTESSGRSTGPCREPRAGGRAAESARGGGGAAARGRGRRLGAESGGTDHIPIWTSASVRDKPLFPIKSWSGSL